jgi:hypothetical protein
MSLREPNKTQADIDREMANEPDVLPSWGGAGSMEVHLRRANKQSHPSDSRSRQTFAERQEFFEENPEVTVLSPEEEKRIYEQVSFNIALDRDKKYFADAVRRNAGLEAAWIDAGRDPKECPFFKNVERDGDPEGVPQCVLEPALHAFVRSRMFAPYTVNNQQRDEVARMLLDFMMTNLINVGLVQSYLRCFKTLELLGVLPAPVRSDAQIKAEADAAPASDGNPVARNAAGEPVTFNIRGKVFRYSQQMLEKLTADQYATVLGIRKPSPRQIQETEQEQRQLKAKEYRTKVVGDTGYTRFDLDQMPSEKYRAIMNLEKDGGGSVGNRS